jgi:hypothetical protein
MSGISTTCFARPAPIRDLSRRRSAKPCRALSIAWPTFPSIVPFLAPEHQEMFGSRESWQRMQELVIDRLLELRE